MAEHRRGNHTITRLTVHIVWVTKYRYQVLKGEIQKRYRFVVVGGTFSPDSTSGLSVQSG